MARKNGFFDRLLDLIGLAEDENSDKEERTSGSRQRSGSSQSRYGTSSGNTYSGSDRPYSSPYRSNYSRSGSSGSSYISSRSDNGASSRYSGFERSSRNSSKYTTRESVDELESAFDQDPKQSTSAPQARSTNVQRSRTQTQPSPRTGSSMRMRYVQMHNLSDSRGVIKDMISGYTMIVNLDDMDDRLVQRCIDTLGGAACAIGADLRSASERTFMIAPPGVEFDYQTNYNADMYQ